jgi:hypothetical protein
MVRKVEQKQKQKQKREASWWVLMHFSLNFSNKKPKEEEGPAFVGFVPHVFVCSRLFCFFKIYFY